MALLTLIQGTIKERSKKYYVLFSFSFFPQASFSVKEKYSGKTPIAPPNAAAWTLTMRSSVKRCRAAPMKSASRRTSSTSVCPWRAALAWCLETRTTTLSTAFSSTSRALAPTSLPGSVGRDPTCPSLVWKPRMRIEEARPSPG